MQATNTILIKFTISLSIFIEQFMFIPNTSTKRTQEEGKGRDLTDSGLPMILETAFVASLRMSEATTASTGRFVNKFNVGITFFF